MATVIPYFELHIRPMFRLIDRDHMTGHQMDLWDYASVKHHANDIARMLRRTPPGYMPTREFGGPWPEGWIAVFEEWVALGCPKLSTATGTYTLIRIAPDQLMLTIAVPLKDGADTAWVEREITPPTYAEYTLFYRPAPTGETADPFETQMVEVIFGSQVADVFMNDADGRHTLPLTV